MDGTIGDDIEERSIMGYDYERTLVAREVVFEPLLGNDVQVIGWLIE